MKDETPKSHDCDDEKCKKCEFKEVCKSDEIPSMEDLKKLIGSEKLQKMLEEFAEGLLMKSLTEALKQEILINMIKYLSKDELILIVQTAKESVKAESDRQAQYTIRELEDNPELKANNPKTTELIEETPKLLDRVTKNALKQMLEVQGK